MAHICARNLYEEQPCYKTAMKLNLILAISNVREFLMHFRGSPKTNIRGSTSFNKLFSSFKENRNTMLRRIVRKIKRRSQLSNLIIFIVLLALVYVCYPSSDSGGDSDTNDPEQLHRVARETGVNEEVFRYMKVRYDKYKNRGTVNGPGEYGAAVHLSAEEQKKADGLFKKEAFNIVASDKVSLERTVKDTRDPA